jgi:hypothetical protein
MANNEAIACHNFFDFRTIPKNSPISIEDCYFSYCQKLRNMDSRSHVFSVTEWLFSAGEELATETQKQRE